MCDSNEKNIEIIHRKIREFNEQNNDKLQEILDKIDEFMKDNEIPKDDMFVQVSPQGWVCPQCGNVINPWYSYCPICYKERWVVTRWDGGPYIFDDGDGSAPVEITINYDY